MVRAKKRVKKVKEAALSARGKQLSLIDDQWIALVMSGAFDPEGIDRRQTRRQTRRGSRRSEVRRQTLRRARRRRRRETPS